MNGYHELTGNTTPEQAEKLLFEGAKFGSFQKILKAENIDYIDDCIPSKKNAVYEAEE